MAGAQRRNFATNITKNMVLETPLSTQPSATEAVLLLIQGEIYLACVNSLATNAYFLPAPVCWNNRWHCVPRYPQSTVFTLCSRSLSGRQRAVCPTYSLFNDSGITYTTDNVQSMNWSRWFVAPMFCCLGLELTWRQSWQFVRGLRTHSHLYGNQCAWSCSLAHVGEK